MAFTYQLENGRHNVYYASVDPPANLQVGTQKSEYWALLVVAAMNAADPPEEIPE